MTAAAPGALLSVSGLSVEFRTSERVVSAVRNVSFGVDRGETIAIVGESGSGKSVTALSLMRLVEHGGGRITSGKLFCLIDLISTLYSTVLPARRGSLKSAG